MVDVGHAPGDRWSAHTPQFLVVALGDRFPRGVPEGQTVELDPSDRCGQIGHSVVEAHDLVAVALLHALVPQQPYLPGDRLVRADHHAALAGRHVLGGVEAEGGQLSDGTCRCARAGRAMRLTGVLEQQQAQPLRQQAKLVRSCGLPEEVHIPITPTVLGVMAASTGSDIQTERVGVDVREDRPRSGDRHRVRRRGKAERRNDDLVAGSDTRRQEAKVQCTGPGVDGYARSALDEAANSCSKAATSSPCTTLPLARPASRRPAPRVRIGRRHQARHVAFTASSVAVAASPVAWLLPRCPPIAQAPHQMSVAAAATRRASTATEGDTHEPVPE